MSADVVLLAAALGPAALAALDWRAVARRDRRTEGWAKPAVMVGLVAVALAMGAVDTTTGRLVLVALVLGMVGDVLLLEDTRPASSAAWPPSSSDTSPGRSVRREWPRATRAGLGRAQILGLALVAGRASSRGARGGRRGARAAGAAYMVVIGAMAVLGWATGDLLVGLGAALFVVSDTVLALGSSSRSARGPAPSSW